MNDYKINPNCYFLHFVKTSIILKIYLSNRTIKVGIGFVFTKARADPLRTNPQPCISLDNPRPHYSCYNLWWSNLESKFSQSFHLLLTIVLSYPWLDILIFMLLLGVRLSKKIVMFIYPTENFAVTNPFFWQYIKSKW